MYYFITILIIGVIIFFLNQKLKSDSSSLLQGKKLAIERIKNNGTIIELDAENCEVIKNDTILKHNYYESSETYGLKFLKIAKYNVKDKYQIQSLLVCRYINSKGLEQKFVKQIPMDSTILRIKINMQKKVKIHINALNNNYYIDLNFLNN